MEIKGSGRCSTLLFSIIYDKTCNEKFRALVLDQFNLSTIS